MGGRWNGGFAALFAVAVVACAPADDAGGPVPSPAPSPSPTSGATATTSATSATVTTVTTATMRAWSVVDVVDGDTLVVDGPGGRTTVRLIGINAPERGECFAAEATDALRSLTNGPVMLVGDVSDRDRFERALRYVETADGLDVGAALVEGGFAIARRYEPDVARYDVYERLQELARSDVRGLWSPDACGAPSTAGVRIGVEINADAPGDDNVNLNEEWVRFTNTGAAPIDLGGWSAADESARHRYSFGDLVLASGASVTLFTGCGTDTQTQRFWCNSGSAVWNNSGDTVFLRDPDGNIVIAERYDG